MIFDNPRSDERSNNTRKLLVDKGKTISWMRFMLNWGGGGGDGILHYYSLGGALKFLC